MDTALNAAAVECMDITISTHLRIYPASPIFQTSTHSAKLFAASGMGVPLMDILMTES